MISEGRGTVAPAIVKVKLDHGSLRTLLVVAQQQAEKYKNRKSRWAGGLRPPIVICNVGSIEQHVRPFFSGLCGEEAVCFSLGKVLHEELHADLRVRPYGDGGIDFQRYGLTAQIKTTQSPKTPNMIRVQGERGNAIDFPSRVCVFCEWSGEVVGIRGWVWWDDVRELPHVPARVGNHRNIEVPPEVLQPWSALCAEYEARKIARGT